MPYPDKESSLIDSNLWPTAERPSSIGVLLETSWSPRILCRDAEAGTPLMAFHRFISNCREGALCALLLSACTPIFPISSDIPGLYINRNNILDTIRIISMTSIDEFYQAGKYVRAIDHRTFDTQRVAANLTPAVTRTYAVDVEHGTTQFKGETGSVPWAIDFLKLETAKGDTIPLVRF